MLIIHFGVTSFPDGGRRNKGLTIARQAKIVPWRLVRSISAMASSLANGNNEEKETPAALTKMSTLFWWESC